MKSTPRTIVLSIVIVLTSAVVAYIGYNYYRSEFMFCTNMPDGSHRCFDYTADFIYEITGGELTIVPRNLHRIGAFATYSAWSSTRNATITRTFVWNPTAMPNGVTEDPTDAANSVATFEAYMMATMAAASGAHATATPEPQITTAPVPPG